MKTSSSVLSRNGGLGVAVGDYNNDFALPVELGRKLQDEEVRASP